MKVSRLGGATLAAFGIFLASHTRDIAVLEGLSQAIVPGLMLVGDMFVAAVLMMRGWS